MVQKRIQPSDSQDQKPKQSDLLDELQARQAQHEQEAAQRAAEQAARDQQEAALEAELSDLDAEIEALLSENSEEFVIRFIQTEGQ